MAKSDSFYIRAQSDAASGGAYAQEEIPLGSFVNLGVKSSTLLRIHNVAVQYADGTIAGGISPELPMHATAAGWGQSGMAVDHSDPNLDGFRCGQVFGDLWRTDALR